MNIEKIKPLVDIEVKYIDDIKGFGVFANQFIPKSTSIEVCYSLKLPNVSLGHPAFDYLYYNIVNKNYYLPFGFGSIYNHSDTPNVYWEILSGEHNIMKYSSINDIKTGDELTISYGDNYWKNRNNKKKLL